MLPMSDGTGRVDPTRGPSSRDPVRWFLRVSFLAVVSVLLLPGWQGPNAAASLTPLSAPTRVSDTGIEKHTTPAAASTTIVPDTKYLDEMPNVAGSYYAESAEVNGRLYTRSVMLWPDGSAQFNLGRDWRRVEATLGLRDDSSEDAKVRFEIFGDGRLLYRHEFGLGQSEGVSIDVTDVLRLKLVATTVAEGDSRAVWGSARVVS